MLTVWSALLQQPQILIFFFAPTSDLGSRSGWEAPSALQVLCSHGFFSRFVLISLDPLPAVMARGVLSTDHLKEVYLKVTPWW